MPKTKKILRLIVLILALAIALSSQDSGWKATDDTPGDDIPAADREDSGNPAGPYEISRVIDGDTISVTIEGKVENVRLIGIDSPEISSPYASAECYGQEASAAAKEKLKDQKIYLESDPVSGDRDRYGRLLRYVILADKTNFDEWMIAEGNAREYTYDGQHYGYRDRFRSAEETAKTEKKGLWGPACANR